MTQEVQAAPVLPVPEGAATGATLHLPAGGTGFGARVRPDGRHLSVDGVPYRVRGVTYGSFRPRRDGDLFPEAPQIRRDLSAMAAVGLNTVRTYTVPPAELLDAAAEVGMRVLVGVHYDDWRQHGADHRVHRRVLDAGRRALDDAIERTVGLPQVLALSIGNEVPGDLVRLHGIRPVERVLSRLAAHVHAADPAALVTYSNFPTTEYLSIDGLDLASFNVFLEDPARLRAYLRHLQIVAGEIPLLVTELGLAGDLHGDAAQAASIEQQLRVVDETGCAGATVFAWTDEWGVAGEAVEGWGFGITRADRTPKAAVDVVRRWAGRSVRDLRERWPPLSVVVCAYNEARLLDECLRSLECLDYPDLEVVVCDDGSTDGTLEIARRYPFRTLALPHGGLSAARNAGARAARGEYVAYLDADAHCHPAWPYHLVLSMQDEGVVAAGGPNLPVPGADLVERAVAASPGGPVEVLVRDDRAEHVPGCNMAFRRESLLAVGGFDPAFTSAGDDVDVCWKLLDQGGQIAFAPAAQVRHHRRNTVRGYLRQQRNYGRSERMVASRHAHRFNRLGQARWAGSIYGGLRMLSSVLRPVVYHGPVGGAPYQTVVAPRAAWVFGWAAATLPLTVPPLVLGLGLAFLHPAWLGLCALGLGYLVGYTAAVAVAVRPARDEAHPWAWRALVTCLHVLQPLVRAWGRLRGPGLPVLPPPPPPGWTGDRLAWLMSLERALAESGCSVRFAGPTDPWDLQVSRGPVLAARLSTAVQWGWTPQARTRIVVRPARLLALTAAMAIVGLLAGTGWAGGLGALLLAADAAFLVPTTRRALRRTTLSALTPGS
ncbi:glycosyltransferase [Blastococcus deserti]|uniref:Glycosyltransferase n=1 Tax=Blastococcus deserti TaxID=2259033 RepID=A0ABW4XF28_9ACTN